MGTARTPEEEAIEAAYHGFREQAALANGAASGEPRLEAALEAVASAIRAVFPEELIGSGEQVWVSPSGRSHDLPWVSLGGLLGILCENQVLTVVPTSPLSDSSLNSSGKPLVVIVRASGFVPSGRPWQTLHKHGVETLTVQLED